MIIIISIIFRIYNKFLSNRFVNGALKGIRPVVIGLIISVGLSLMITNFADISGKISINYNVILISLLTVLRISVFLMVTLINKDSRGFYFIFLVSLKICIEW